MAHLRSPGSAASLAPPRCSEPSWSALRHQQLRALRRDRQPHHKRATNAVRIVPRDDFALMRVDDAVADAQPETRALAHFLRREEWIEDALRMRNSRPVVAKRDLHLPVAMRRGDLHLS